MQTKLVYVLTCAPEATYIEQALISIWSARYHNPDAHIVLLVDDLTNQLLVGKRAEVLEYITEKVVIPFEDTNATMMYRSRWIKTQVRQLIKGDFLFIDCDTITQRSLGDIDDLDCEVGAVLESHLPVCEFNDSLYQGAKELNAKIGVDIDAEQLYFSSGVLLVKGTKKTYKLYELWHQFWKEGHKQGLKIDQPALAKANREVGHIIGQIPDTYNCILFTRPIFIREAYILHIAAYQNPSFLFTDRVLKYVRENGIGNEWLQKMILNPCATMMPFDYCLKNSSCKELRVWRRELADAWKGYGENIDAAYTDFPMRSRVRRMITYLLKHRCIRLAMYMSILWQRTHLQYTKSIIKPNMCAK